MTTRRVLFWTAGADAQDNFCHGSIPIRHCRPYKIVAEAPGELAIEIEISRGASLTWVWVCRGNATAEQWIAGYKKKILVQFIKPGGFIGIVDIAFTREVQSIEDAPEYLRPQCQKALVLRALHRVVEAALE